MRAFSFEAKRRGAARVLAAYSWVWKDPKLNARDLGAGDRQGYSEIDRL